MKEPHTQIWSPSFFISESERGKKKLLAKSAMNTFAVCKCVIVRVCVCAPANLPHCRRCWALKIFLSLLSTRFSNVDVYHLSSPAIYRPLLLVDNPQGSEFAKMWISPLHLASLSFPFRSSYLAACGGERGWRGALRGGFKEFGTSASYGWYSLNRPKSPLSFRAVLVTGCSNHRSGTRDSWTWW